MVNRINEILKRYKLTAAKRAEQLEVPRSTISHILSERNKPSLEFIQKIINRYPEINIYWLLKGVGNFNAYEQYLW
jgi:transcriptional regulator with XRE-family HTH domain